MPRKSLTLVGLTFIIAGLVIGALSYPVSETSHAVAEEVKRRNPGKEGVRRFVEKAARGGRLAEFVQGRPDDHEVVQLFRIVVALLALLWCCCVCIAGGLAEVVIEPLGQILGSAAQFSVYTMAALFVLYGLIHIVIGVRLMRGLHASWGTRLVLLVDGSQGVTLLGASLAFWDAAAPQIGLVALGLAAVLITWVSLAWSLLFRQLNADAST